MTNPTTPVCPWIFSGPTKRSTPKRRWLILEIGYFPLPAGNLNDRQIQTVILDVVFKLAEQGKLFLYQQPLQLSNEFDRTGILLENITTEIAHLLATGQIDIKTDLTITFTGDKRVLSDLLLLAQSGYGEDCFGNNIALPKELAYLPARATGDGNRTGSVAQLDHRRPQSLQAGRSSPSSGRR